MRREAFFDLFRKPRREHRHVSVLEPCLVQSAVCSARCVVRQVGFPWPFRKPPECVLTALTVTAFPQQSSSSSSGVGSEEEERWHRLDRMATSACPAGDYSFRTPFPSPYFDTGLHALVRGQIVLSVSLLAAVYLRVVVGGVKPGFLRLLMVSHLYPPTIGCCCCLRCCPITFHGPKTGSQP